MTTILRYLRSNAVAFLALFIALGGVGWAATSLPAGSVGSHARSRIDSITPVKFNRSMIGGSVRYWARISADGKIIASHPKARIVVWYSTPAGLLRRRLDQVGKADRARMLLARYRGELSSDSVSVSAETVPGNGGLGTQVASRAPNAIVPVDVAVICP